MPKDIDISDQVGAYWRYGAVDYQAPVPPTVTVIPVQ